MSLFTCDNCHYTFEADFIPTSCPDCGKDTYNHKVGQRIVSLACIRPATEGELAQYEKVQQEIKSERKIETANNSFTEKLKMLGEPYFGNPLEDMDEDEDSAITPDDRSDNVETDVNKENSMDENEEVSLYPPDPYNLPIREHNFALMVIYYLKQMGRFYGKQDLEKMIMSTDVDEKVALYKNVKKIFTCGINDEERGIEKPYRVNKEIWNAATPALKTLYAFRQDDDFKRLMGDVPNRGNIKRIDLEKLATEPSEGFMRFMTELYNGIKE